MQNCHPCPETSHLIVSVGCDTIEHMFERATIWDTVHNARSTGDVLDELLMTEPGPWMLSILDAMSDVVDGGAEHEKLLMCWDRFMPWAQAQRAHAMVGAAEGQSKVSGPFGVDDLGAEVVALVTGDTIPTAGLELETARALQTELHGCRSALERGEISWRMANDVARATSHLKVWERELVDQRMVSSWTLDRDITKWRRKLRREVLKVDDDAEARRKRAVIDRNVATWPLPDGMACVRAELKAEDAATIMAALNAVADRYGADDRAAAAASHAANGDHTSDPGDPRDTSDPGDPGDPRDTGDTGDWIDPESFDGMSRVGPQLRTMDQRRADALVDICADVLADPDLPKRQGRRATVQATGGILTLLGLRNDPGELAGYGPITAEHLREIAADAEWHRFITAPDTGALISIGTATYRPKQALRNFMMTAEPRCDFPGCGIPSQRTDAEHTLSHRDGGATDPTNVRPRCRRHHRCKTHAGWLVELLPDGRVKWTSPSGTYRIIAPHRLAGDESGDDSADSADSADS